jgi:hypothetical protein
LQIRVAFGRKQYVVEELSEEGIKEGCREQPGTKRVDLECNYSASASILADVLAKLFCDSFELERWDKPWITAGKSQI